MLVHRVDPAEAAELLSIADADRLLTSSAIRTPAVRLVKDAQIIAPSRYTQSATLAGQPMTGLIDARKLLQLVEEGATAVLQGLQRYWPPITTLLAQLEVDLGHPCQANAYLTPAGSQGFAPHSDSHDVFVVQTAGSKLWQIEEDGETRELLMEPGVVLYLPTGTVHSARAQDAASLHVTIGINQFTWRQAMTRAVQGLLEEIPDDHLPAGAIEDPTALTVGFREQLDQLVQRLQAADPQALTEQHINRFLTTRPPRLPGGLTDVLTGTKLVDTTVLRRRAGHPCVVRDLPDGRIRMLLGDRALEMPGWVRPAAQQIAAATTFTPADLTDLDPESRLVLCRRLVREGLLEQIP